MNFVLVLLICYSSTNRMRPIYLTTNLSNHSFQKKQFYEANFTLPISTDKLEEELEMDLIIVHGSYIQKKSCRKLFFFLSSTTWTKYKLYRSTPKNEKYINMIVWNRGLIFKITLAVCILFIDTSHPGEGREYSR